MSAAYTATSSKRNHQQPLASLPHVTTIDQCERMLITTEIALEDLVESRRARPDWAIDEQWLIQYREYHRLLRELRIRHAELVARQGGAS